jgi:polyphosphate kinase
MNDQFFNRELSWLAFNDRVFAEAANPSNPLLERLRFATIVASNLDEFFMVRVAALKNAIYEGDTRPDDSGMTPSQQLEAVSERANTMLGDLHTLVWDALVPALAEHAILIRRRLAHLSAAEHAAVSAYIKSDVLAALTPLAIDMERPFPMLSTLSLNLAVWLRPADGGVQHRLAVVQVPSGLSRLVRVTEDSGAWVIDLEGRGDLTMERLAATSRADLLVDVFGQQVVIRGAGASL